VLVVVVLVLAQDPPQMGLMPDEGSVQGFAAAPADPALGDRVHAGRPDVAEHGPDASVGKDCVDRGGRGAWASGELVHVSQSPFIACLQQVFRVAR
jgi:hypothetical protein